MQLTLKKTQFKEYKHTWKLTSCFYSLPWLKTYEDGDFCKAFDTIPHNIFLSELERCGLDQGLDKELFGQLHLISYWNKSRGESLSWSQDWNTSLMKTGLDTWDVQAGEEKGLEGLWGNLPAPNGGLQEG